jgi:dienelactone hydrolase
MATLVLFHSALGLRPGVTRFADRLRARGHEVRTPDLYDGEVFDHLTEGVAHRDHLGVPELMQRATAAVQDLPGDVVYAGMSMGAAPAQWLAATRPGALGALLVHGCLPLEMFGLERWPATVPVQLHVSEDDPWVDPDGVDGFAAAVPPGLLEHATYPGTRHLFSDDDSSDHDPEATGQLVAAAAKFLDTAAARAVG